MNLHIPKVKIKSQKHPKWYNSDIRHHLNWIHTLRKRCISHPTIHNSAKLQLSETQIQHQMLAAKANFEAELILNCSSNNISRVYKCINSITRHDTIPQNVTLDSKWPPLILKKANLFSTQSLHRVHSTYTSSWKFTHTFFNNLRHHNIRVWCLWCIELAAELAEDWLQGWWLYVGYWLQNWLRIGSKV